MNYTKERVIQESSLVDIYRNCHHNIERNFHLAGLTNRHAPTNLVETFRVLAVLFSDNRPNEHQAGRKSKFSISNKIDDGQNNIDSQVDKLPDVDGTIEADDLAGEVA